MRVTLVAALDVAEHLAGLFHAGVQVANDGLGAQHELAVELQHETQHAVSRGVGRTHVDDHRLVVATLEVDVVRIQGEVTGAQNRADLATEFVGARGLARLKALETLGGFGGDQVDAFGDANASWDSLIADLGDSLN